MLRCARLSLVLGLLLAFVVPQTALAGPGDLDPTFGEDGIVTGGLGSGVDDLLTLPDGKFIMASIGDAGSYLVRFNSDGGFDTSFGGGDGSVLNEIGGQHFGVAAIARQQDGKIVVAGAVNVAPPPDPPGEDPDIEADFALARYSADGAPDPSFGSDGLVTVDLGSDDDMITSVVIQSDGKVVAGGWTYTEETIEGENDWEDFTFRNYNFALARFNADGSLDTSFSDDGKVITDIPGSGLERVRALLLQPDGKLVAVGRADSSSLEEEGGFSLARYNSDGSLDLSFGNGGLVTKFDVNRIAHTAALQPDGKIVVAGSWGGDTFSLSRFNPNGSLDTNFGDGGSVNHSFARPNGTIGRSGSIGDLAIQPDGRILAGGLAFDEFDFSSDDFALARYTPNGALDTSFGGDGMVLTDAGDGGYNNYATALALQADGKIILGGSTGSPNYNFALVRYEGGGPPLVQHTLTINITGEGSVASSPGGIDCGSVCSSDFYEEETIRLTATAGEDSFLLGWSWPGGASGCTFDESASYTCDVTLTDDAVVTAEFKASGDPKPTLKDDEDQQPSEGSAPQPTDISLPPKTANPPKKKANKTARKKAAAKKRAQARKLALRRCRTLKGKAKRRCIRKVNKRSKKQGKHKAGTERCRTLKGKTKRKCVRGAAK